MSGVGQLEPAGAAGWLGSLAGFSAPFRLAASLLLITALALGVTSCGGNGERLGERVIPLGQPVPKGGGVYRIGDPYQAAGTWYTPRDDPSYNRIGRASWYGELFHGRRTANGEIYDMDRLSAAHPTLPLPVYAQVTNLANGRGIVVRINDRGPYARDRIIDLSRRSAELLGFRANGTTNVLWPMPDGFCRWSFELTDYSTRDAHREKDRAAVQVMTGDYPILNEQRLASSSKRARPGSRGASARSRGKSSYVSSGVSQASLGGAGYGSPAMPPT